MLTKKWLNIILCCWLINSVTYFHGINAYDAGPCDNQQCIKINTWADHLAQQISDDDDDTQHHVHKIDSQRRYINSRVAGIESYVAEYPSAISCYAFNKTLLTVLTRYTIGIAWLPSYYNFLFRLSPF